MEKLQTKLKQLSLVVLGKWSRWISLSRIWGATNGGESSQKGPAQGHQLRRGGVR
jgi:hypothetical protein